ncbi:putative quinol monooxygenase [Lutibaculum baratangense]|uniref:ABM domain-containing protein n=1 Tax=Lutibaculum baratangense AMV1 TaxID=631454 RepID=V4RMP6_9HYPH|nr:antibiotic biosynthesis monooxygenase family protein [Lutibaculum baratangense]ESR26549.1 hypothetical protein N177_0768 [Lutibaculum baratangense AMV1]
MYAVVTRVKVMPGTMDELAATFRAMHPSTVEHETEWRSARLLADRDRDLVTIVEIWHSADAYRRYASTPSFLHAMSKLERCFDGAPEVSITEVLADFEHTSAAAQGIAFGPG